MGMGVEEGDHGRVTGIFFNNVQEKYTEHSISIECTRTNFM